MLKRKIIKKSSRYNSREKKCESVEISIQNNESTTLYDSKISISYNLDLNPPNKIFNVIHKKETNFTNNNNNSLLVKCIYCGEKCCNRKFEAHMRIHVSF